MIQLSNGKWYSGVSIVPKNRKLASASLKTSWYIPYRHYSKEDFESWHIRIKERLNR